jgi:hypothetical protein
MQGWSVGHSWDFPCDQHEHRHGPEVDDALDLDRPGGRHSAGEAFLEGLAVTGVRCGWCISNDHAHCVVNLEMGRPSAFYLWSCTCACHVGKTRCVLCGRRDVEVVSGRCADAASCESQRATASSAPAKVGLP